jgi:hypothetical protein
MGHGVVIFKQGPEMLWTIYGQKYLTKINTALIVEFLNRRVFISNIEIRASFNEIRDFIIQKNIKTNVVYGSKFWAILNRLYQRRHSFPPCYASQFTRKRYTIHSTYFTRRTSESTIFNEHEQHSRRRQVQEGLHDHITFRTQQIRVFCLE